MDNDGVVICLNKYLGRILLIYNCVQREQNVRAIREKKAAYTGSKFKELVPEFIYSVINCLIYQNCIVGLFTAVHVIITANHANFDGGEGVLGNAEKVVATDRSLHPSPLL